LLPTEARSVVTDFRLKKLPGFAGVRGPVITCVMDGVGLGARDEGDAVFLARTPTLDRLAALPAVTRLVAHGTAVGMPSDADMGNSEVGHNALGAGRTFDQGAKLVDQAIQSGALWKGQTWQALCARVVKHGGTFHLIGLLSDGNVHSHITHLLAMLEQLDREGVARVRVHPLLDGRDVGETSALDYVDRLEASLAALNQKAGRDYRIASGGGRQQVTMDRYEADWSLVARGWQLHVRGEGRRFANTRQAVDTLRAEQPGVIDQDLPGFVIADASGPVGPVRDGDSVVLFNFRGDRAIEISRAFDDAELDSFERGARPDVLYAGMMEYDADSKIPAHYLVTPPLIERTLSEYLVHNDVYQLAVSETQKFGHVTYFWNGNRSGMLDETRETYVEVLSDRVPFEQRPWMKAAEITDAVIDALKTGKIGAGRLNYANGDMVGHTGHRDAAVLAVETVDLCLARLLPVIAKLEGVLLVTADHGNADEMFERGVQGIKRDAQGRTKAKTSHTLNPVPLYVFAPVLPALRIDRSIARPTLANVAATTLKLLGFEAPDDFEPALVTLDG
jgi:2,3-bisphosphoglycerate-independent phosphoglycerate mutase